MPEPSLHHEGRWLTAEEIEASLDEPGAGFLVPEEVLEAERAREAAARWIYLSHVDAYVKVRDMGPAWDASDPQPVIVQEGGEEFFVGKGGQLIPVPSLDEW